MVASQNHAPRHEADTKKDKKEIAVEAYQLKGTQQHDDADDH